MEQVEPVRLDSVPHRLSRRRGAMVLTRKQIGVAVVGSGRIGTHRARLAAQHPGVRYLAVSDVEAARARSLGERVGADLSSASNEEVIARPEVDVVIVSTPEPAHVAPVLHAIELGKPVLVEKPIAMTLEDADRIIGAAETKGVEVRVGYIMRYKRQYFLGK